MFQRSHFLIRALFVCAGCFGIVLANSSGDYPAFDNALIGQEPSAKGSFSGNANDGFEKIATPFFKTYCLECHDDDAKGDFEIATALPNDFLDLAAKGNWSEVVNVLNGHEMPPEGSTQPTVDETAALVDWITQQMIASEQHSRTNRIVMRRLNRSEYQNTIRDLVGIEFDASIFPQDSSAGGFDNNGRALTLSPLHLEMYYDAARKILDDALVTGDRPEPIKWRFEHENASGDYNWQDFGEQRIIIHGAQNRKEGGFTVLHHNGWDRRPDAREFHVPHPGKYTIRIRAASKVPNRNEVIRSADIFLNQRRGQRMFEIPEGDYATKEYDRNMEHFKTDPIYDYGNPRLSATLTLDGSPHKFPAIEIDAPLSDPQEYILSRRFTTDKGGILLEYAYDIPKVLENFWFQNEDQFARPEVWVDWTELEGPIYESWPPSTHTRIVSDSIPVDPKRQRELAEKIIARFATSAFRRPATPAEVDSKLKLFDQALASLLPEPELTTDDSASKNSDDKNSDDKNVDANEVSAEEVSEDQVPEMVEGELRLPTETPDPLNSPDGFDAETVEPKDDHKAIFIEAIKAPLTAILISPDFLYIAEPTPRVSDAKAKSNDPNEPRPLDHFELASRLSYFLTSSMPDEALIELASNGKLSQSDSLVEQVDRLLAEEKSGPFTQNFAGQWLGLRAVGSNPPTPDLFPRYDRHLETSIVAESEAFFAEILKNDLSCANFIRSDFVVVNERLARFYGIPQVKGDHFRRVDVPEGVHRGGLVTQASMLTITSNGTRTSPVKRGTWVLKNVLGMDPGLPVANAGEIAPKVPGIDKATVRKRLEIHRELSQCARCHNKIDPLGFALENFDASGRWRDKEGFGFNGRPGKDDPEIDASSVLPDGTEINGVDGLQAAMLEKKDLFYNCLAEKMFTYALGRELSIVDRPEIKKAVEHMKENDETLRSLIKYIVTSPPFLTK